MLFLKLCQIQRPENFQLEVPQTVAAGAGRPVPKPLNLRTDGKKII